MLTEVKYYWDFERSLDQNTSWPFKDKIGDLQWYDITTRQVWHMHLDNMFQLIRCIFYRKCPPPSHFWKKGNKFQSLSAKYNAFHFPEQGKAILKQHLGLFCFQNMPTTFTNRHFNCFWTGLNAHMCTLLIIFFHFGGIIRTLVIFGSSSV